MRDNQHDIVAVWYHDLKDLMPYKYMFSQLYRTTPYQAISYPTLLYSSLTYCIWQYLQAHYKNHILKSSGYLVFVKTPEDNPWT